MTDKEPLDNLPTYAECNPPKVGFGPPKRSLTVTIDEIEAIKTYHYNRGIEAAQARLIQMHGNTDGSNNYYLHAAHEVRALKETKCLNL